MPRPPDTYTHSQFVSIDPNNEAGHVETARCIHCNVWQGNIRNLARKKDHLASCPQYIAWRQAGNGRDVAPHNSYNKRDSSARDSLQQDQTPEQGYGTQQYTPELASRPGGKVLQKDYQKDAYEEYYDESQKCVRVRCKHCGFVRAKNSTRQLEHLFSTCNDFLSSADGQLAKNNGDLDRFNASKIAPAIQNNGSEIWRGKAPNPGISVGQRGPDKRPRVSGGNATTPSRPAAPARPTPSLATHLLSREASAVTSATQQAFLSHAGCGTLSASALQQWLTQDHHISRGFVAFIGNLIGKVRLPVTAISQQNTSYRVLDLLISTLNNVRREMTFFEATAQKFGLQIGKDDPKPVTKAYLDLFAGASGHSASLLEGLVLLWVTEHLYRTSWHYASTFTNTIPSSTYSLPSYLTTGPGDSANPYAQSSAIPSDEPHLAALHQSLVPNWTSPAFSKFVDACRAIVDELANSQTSGNGREEMARCETVFKQAIWLWQRLWPAVDGMGSEQDDLDMSNMGASVSPVVGKSGSGAHTNVGASSSRNNGGTIQIQDDDEDEDHDTNDQDAHGGSMDSPFGGTGLGAVHAANLQQNTLPPARGVPSPGLLGPNVDPKLEKYLQKASTPEPAAAVEVRRSYANIPVQSRSDDGWPEDDSFSLQEPQIMAENNF
ncbi:hypothetical protein B0A48_00331 [Cryoendolithus antarcticus]|uniref:Heme oxygenase-like protein n=1 Tax=Cryoendolithus antarcticus TaxID=1507870 RepID=A0A1V8TUC5_9PEZI|nr:hypothetical protein B0A48_00331 [Cryoendolithus antarcticus]